MPQYGGIVGVGYGGGVGGGGGGGSDIEVLHDTSIADPIPILYVTPGSKQSTTATNTSALQALTQGIFTVDGISTPQIDFSGVPNGVAGLSPIIALMDTAIATNPNLADYSVGLDYIAPNFFFVVRHTGGDVGVLSGDIVTAMGLTTVTEVSFSPKSDSIFIAAPASGYWRELRFFSIVSIRRASTGGTSKATYITDGTDTYSWLSALSSTGAWWEEASSNEASGLYNVGKAVNYSSVYSDFMYNPITGEITWDDKIGVVPTQTETYKMDRLFVLGIRGS